MIARIFAQEDLNFLVTNRIPRRLATRFLGWFSKIEQPLVRDLSIKIWRFFSDVDLSDARDARFSSMHALFTRRLVDGARTADPDRAVLASPCDAIVGACGRIAGDRLYQAKGFPYALSDLMDAGHAALFRNGHFVTLRLTAGMYHRFHAPHDCAVESVHYVSGDTWNVNPIALRRVERLFCKNERALILTRLAEAGAPVLLAAVGAILVASVRLTFLDDVRAIPAGGVRLDPPVPIAKGAEMGWFEHGSTIILFAPEAFRFCEEIIEGAQILAGTRLMHLPPSAVVDLVRD